MLRKYPLRLIPSRLWTGILPAAHSREAKPMGPGPGAPHWLQTFPNSKPTCHGEREGQLSGAPGRLPRPPAAEAPPLSAGRWPHSQAWACPIFGPAPRRPAALGESLPPQRRGDTARRRSRAGPGSQPPKAEGVSGTVNAPGPAPSPARGSASHLPLPLPPPLHASPGRGPDPTRLRPLRFHPGQARGGAGASPKRLNPPPGQPPPAPGYTRGRAGEGVAEAADPRARVQS